MVMVSVFTPGAVMVIVPWVPGVPALMSGTATPAPSEFPFGGTRRVKVAEFGNVTVSGAPKRIPKGYPLCSQIC
jgi:hypothetical protein